MTDNNRPACTIEQSSITLETWETFFSLIFFGKQQNITIYCFFLLNLESISDLAGKGMIILWNQFYIDSSQSS